MKTCIHFLGSILLGSLVAITGCSSDPNNNNTGGAGGSSSGDLTLDELAKKIISIRCATAIDCHTSETVAECEATSKSTIEPIRPYVDNGTVVYHPEKAAACLGVAGKITGCSYSAIANPDAQNEVEAACSPVFEGTVADGGKCFDDVQCKSQHCSTDPSCMMQCCTGTCAMTQAVKPIAKVGEPCATAECVNGTYCQTDMAGLPTTCAAQIAAGQPCTDFGQCLAPGNCNLDFSTGNGTCYIPAAHGATCEPKSFLPCDRFDDVCDVTTNKCVSKTAIGANCQMVPCVDYAHCDTTTKNCTKNGTEGAACDPTFDLCLNDLMCLSTSKCGFSTPTACN